MNDRNRKTMRLKKYDYNTPGAYFITLCTKDRKPILSRISVGTGVLDGPKAGVLDGPKIQLSSYGRVAEEQILRMSRFYDNVSVDAHVIMPNHIHLLIQIHKTEIDGPSRTPVPTNAVIPRFISTFKRFCNRDYGENIWQNSFYDHIIRNETDYLSIWEYIRNNPAKWHEDKLYTE